MNKKFVVGMVVVVILAGVVGYSILTAPIPSEETPEPTTPSPSLLTITGVVVAIENRELYYQDNQGFGSGKIIPVPITFLTICEDIVDKQGEQIHIKYGAGLSYEFILVGPHNLEKGSHIQLTYLADEEITGWEIWNRYYPERKNSHLIDAPAVLFKVDGYVISWQTPPWGYWDD